MTENSTTDTYAIRGVSSSKEEVHAAIKHLYPGLYKDTFAKVLPDIFTHDHQVAAEQCIVSHSDGAGTKAIAAYLYFKETGDASIFRGIAVDSIVMNLDDMIACGVTGPFAYTQIINRNKNHIPQEVLSELINGAQEFFDKMSDYGIHIHFAGGETADLGDSVRTITVDGSMTALAQRHSIVHINIQPGDYIVGLASDGNASYEEDYNSGIGSNGLTDARHDLLSKYFAEKYQEAYDPATDQKYVYRGRYDSFLAGGSTGSGNLITIKKILLSPTRTYAPILKKVLEESSGEISGIIHCSGGGQGKVLNFIQNISVLKNNMFPIPETFKRIQEESGKSMEGMLRTYNMGHRMEIYVRGEENAKHIVATGKSFGVASQIVGMCSAKVSGAEVIVQYPGTEAVVLTK